MDRDFKWYYELMGEAARREIKAEIGRGDLPFPRLSGAHFIGGQNCFPARSVAVKFYSPRDEVAGVASVHPAER